MKRHLGWIRVAAAAAMMAGGPHSFAQYAPYRALPQTTPPTTAIPSAATTNSSSTVAKPAGTAPVGMAPVATVPTGTAPRVARLAPAVAPQRPSVVAQQQASAATQQVAAQAVVAGQQMYPQAYMPYQPKTAQQMAVPQPAAATPYVTPGVATYPQVAAAYPQVAMAYPQAAATYPAVAPAYPQTATAYSPTYPQTADRYSPYYSTVAQDSNGQLPPPEQVLPTPANGLEPNGLEANGVQPEGIEEAGPPMSDVPATGEPMNGGPANGPMNDAPTNGASANGMTNGAANGHDMPNGMHRTHDELIPVPNGHNGYHGYPTTNYNGAACDEGGYPDYGLSGYFDNPCHDAQWFGGVYFLWMERDNSSPVKLTARVDHSTATDPYYPLGHTTVLSTPDFDYREGVEVRIGSTFTISGPCDDCNSGCGSPYYGYGYGGNSCGSCNPCAPACPDVYAWEAAWWAIDDEDQQDTYADGNPTLADQVRIYGMVNFAGLEYDRDSDGTYDNTVNTYYGYQLPIVAPPAAPAPDGYAIVLAQRVRQNFDAQNWELNFIRFPLCEASCGSCATGCDAGGCGDYAHGYGDACGCETECCPRAFSMYGSCGVRYFRADEAFLYASESGVYTGGVIDQAAADGWNGGPNELYYTIDVENHLIGGQLGWTMNYCVACKWNFFANSTFGVFNNHIDHYQRVYGGGVVRFAQNGETARVGSDKDDIAFLGELRLGGSYDVTCNCRVVAAYRAVAIAGVATSTDQIPSDFTSREYVAIIDSDNSMIVHGLQVGAECRY